MPVADLYTDDAADATEQQAKDFISNKVKDRVKAYLEDGFHDLVDALNDNDPADGKFTMVAREGSDNPDEITIRFQVGNADAGAAKNQLLIAARLLNLKGGRFASGGSNHDYYAREAACKSWMDDLQQALAQS